MKIAEKHFLFANTHCCFVQHFNGERFCHVMLTKSLFQLLERRSLPLPKHHQIDITECQKTKQQSLNTHQQNRQAGINCSSINKQKGLTWLEDTALC